MDFKFLRVMLVGLHVGTQGARANLASLLRSNHMCEYSGTLIIQEIFKKAVCFDKMVRLTKFQIENNCTSGPTKVSVS